MSIQALAEASCTIGAATLDGRAHRAHAILNAGHASLQTPGRSLGIVVHLRAADCRSRRRHIAIDHCTTSDVTAVVRSVDLIISHADGNAVIAAATSKLKINTWHSCGMPAVAAMHA
jgi:hypothetical protein